jgi:ElaB/YqjD/DUF883 family membrane-anchored ribosome-binding protein
MARDRPADQPGDPTMPDDNMAAAEAAPSDAATAKRAAKAAVGEAADRGQQSLDEAIELADRSIREAAKRIDKAVREGVEAIRAQTAPYREQAGQQFDEAQKYVVERVKERPVTATLAGLAVGLLLGMMLAGRSSK